MNMINSLDPSLGSEQEISLIQGRRLRRLLLAGPTGLIASASPAAPASAAPQAPVIKTGPPLLKAYANLSPQVAALRNRLTALMIGEPASGTVEA